MTEEQKARAREAMRRYRAKHPEAEKARNARKLKRIQADPIRLAAHHEKQRRHYIKHREARQEYAREYARKRRRMRGVPNKQQEMEARARAREEARLAREAERAATAEQRRERRAEQHRRQARNYRQRYPDKKREQDRAWREANKDKVRAATKMRKARAQALGYPCWEHHKEYTRKRSKAITAAHSYLVSIGVAEWWGPQETTEARRQAAYEYAKQHGLLP